MKRTTTVEPTPYPDLNEVLRELVRGMQAVLGGSFIGACLQGSFAVGDFDLHSDVDWIAVVEEEPSPERVEELQILHERIFSLGHPWAQHLEGSYFPREVLRRCDRRGELLWYLDNGHRSLIRADHCNTAVVRWSVREKGIALAGPEPASLVDPIPVETLRAEILETMIRWGEEILADPGRIGNRFYQTFAVLSYCRMLHDLRAGSVGSKRTGAEWAKVHLDPSWWDLIDRAWDGRPVPEVSIRIPADPVDLERTLELIRLVMRLGKEYMSASGEASSI